MSDASRHKSAPRRILKSGRSLCGSELAHESNSSNAPSPGLSPPLREQARSHKTRVSH
ncbi:hypothetical protein F4W70_16245 [Pseudomonas cannabina]|nr:hypothetical protein F4W70_16245 [Pseudomonas cannabina]